MKIISLYSLLILALTISCTKGSKKIESNKETPSTSSNAHNKPGSSFQDTLFINTTSVVFYQPDSIQLNNIKSVTDPAIFDGSMHEYFYQIRNAQNVLKQNWSHLNVIESKNVRYLAFTKSDKTKHIIDLDKFNDAYGMFVFDQKKAPIPVEMTNLESIIYVYLSN